jgi:predicted phage tail protein
MIKKELLSRTMLYKPMRGAGGGGKQSGSSTPPTRTPDTLRSADSVEVIIGIGEGEIGGLVNGAKSFFVGDTVLQNADNTLNFEYFELEIRPGLPEDSADFLVPKLGGTSNNIPVNTALSSGVAVVRQMTQNQIDAIDLRLNVQQLFRQDDNGVYVHELNVSVEIKKDTDTIWLPAFQNATLPIRGKTTSTYVKELRIPVARTDDFWQVRVTKWSTNTDNNQATDVVWDSIQMINFDLKKYANTATCRVFAQATNQFSQIPEFSGIYKGRIVKVPSNYDTINRTYDGVWDGTFALSVTDNTAWILYDFVLNTRYGMSSAIQLNMDKYEVYDTGVWCDTPVDNGSGGFRPRYTFNGLISEPASAIETARYIAGTFNATLFDDGNGTIILRADMNQDATHLFSLENVTEEGFSYSFTDINSRYNDITVSFLNPDLNYAEDRRRVFDQDHIDEFGRVSMDFIAVGCTNPVEAVARANYKLLTGITEKQLVTFNTNRLGGVVEPFEVILVGDPTAGYALTGRIKSLNLARTVVTLRDALYLEVGTDYVMQIRGVGGLSSEHTVTVPSSGLVTQFNVSPALPSDTPEFAVFYLAEDPGEGIGAPKPFRVMSIEELQDDPDHIKITAHEINRNKFEDAETGIIHEPTQYSGLGDPSSIPGPTNVEFTETFNLNGNEVWLILTVTLPRNQYRYYTGEFEVWSRQLDEDDLPLGSFEQRVVQYGDTIINHPPGKFEFKILPKNSLGQTPPIGSVTSWEHVVGSAETVGTPPQPVENITYQLTPTGFIVQWDPPAGQTTVIHHYKVTEGVDEESATVLADNLKDPILVLDPMTKRSYNLFIYAVSTAQVPSDAENVTITNSAPVPPSNIRVEVGYETVMIFFDRNTEIDLVGYRIQFRQVGQNTWLDMDPSGLFDQGQPDTAYEFRVAAIDALTVLLEDEIWSTPRSVRTRNTIGVAQGIDEVKVSTTQNLVRNGSFERGMQFWNFNTSTVENDPTAPYIDPVLGTTNIAMVGDGTSVEGSIVSDKFVVRSNQNYSIGADFRADEDDPGESHIFTLRVYDSDQNLLYDYTEDEGKIFIDPAQISTDVFTRITSTFLIPGGGVYADVLIHARGQGILHVDGVQAQRGAVATAFNPHVAEELTPEDLDIIANPDNTPPGEVTGLSAAAGFRTVTLTFTPPSDSDVDHYDVFRHTANVLSSASQVGDAIANVYVDTGVLTGLTYYYWVRAVDRSGNPGDFTGPVNATTTPLTLADFQDLSIVNAKIANATIDDAKIATVSAGKLTAGTITAGLISLGNDRFKLESNLRRLTVQDDLNMPRVLLGKLGSGNQDYGIQIYNSSGFLILGADGLGINVVGAGQLQDGAVTTDKLVANAVDVDKLAANSVTAVKMVAGSVTTPKLAAGAVTADKMTVAVLSAIVANLGTVTAGTLQANGLSAEHNYWNLDTGAFSIGRADGAQYMRFNPDTGNIEIKGTVIIEGGENSVDWSDIENRPTNLAGINQTEGDKLAGIAAGADVTGSNTSANTNNVGSLTTAQAIAKILDPAATINQTATTIDGAKITTGTIVANRLSVATLSAISANIGTVTAGLLRNGANTAFMNLDASGGQQFLNCGNNFIVDANGNVTLNSGSINGNLIVAGSITAGQIVGNGITEMGAGTNQVTVVIEPGTKIMFFVDLFYINQYVWPPNGGNSLRMCLATDPASQTGNPSGQIMNPVCTSAFWAPGPGTYTVRVFIINTAVFQWTNWVYVADSQGYKGAAASANIRWIKVKR